MQVWASAVASSDTSSGCDINKTSIAVAACSNRSSLTKKIDFLDNEIIKQTYEEQVDMIDASDGHRHH